MKVLGLDIGTTTISAVVVEDGRSLGGVTRKNDSFISTENPWERIQSPAYIRENALEMVQALVAEHPDIACIGITGQMHGILYLDQKGNAVSPLYTWQDARGNQPYQNGATYARYLSEASGYPLASGYGLVTHFYNMVMGCVPADAAKLCTVQDYIAMTLAGACEPVTDTTDAASLGFFDVKAGSFDIGALVQLGIDPGVLPKISNGCIGYYKNIRVYMAIGDNQASFYGATRGDLSAILVNVGTGSQFSAYTEDYTECNGLEVRPFPGKGYLLVGASLCGGRAYALLEKFYRSVAEACGLELDSCYDMMNQLLETEAKPRDIPKIMPLFQGTRSNPELRGSILNLNPDNFNPIHMTWAMLVGMAEELCGLYRIYRGKIDSRPQRLIGSGNGLRKNVHFQKVVSEQFEMPLVLSECEEEAAVGAALYAAACE